MRWLAVLLLGCGPTVTPLSLHDGRLPPEARRWVADAEDAVVVARARLSDARIARRETAAWRGRLQAALPLPGGGDVGSKLEALLEARTRFAAAQVQLGEAELDLTQARLQQAYAETAMRHDLDVYELEPIKEEVNAAQAEVGAAKAASDDAERAMSEATTAWWTAYRGFVAAGGDATALWVNR